MSIYVNTWLFRTRIYFLIIMVSGTVCVQNSIEAQIPLNSDDPYLANPSFEGSGDENISPPFWTPCGFGSIPDPQPNMVGVHLAPSDGEAYISMRVRGTYPISHINTRENVYSRLKKPLERGKCYTMSVDLAHDELVYYFGILTPSKPTVLRVWGGSECDTAELLAISPVIDNTSWETYNLILTPLEGTYNYIYIEPYYATDIIYHGILLVDNIRISSIAEQTTIKMDTLVWPGTEITFNPSESNNYQWLPVTGLDCSDCRNPTVIIDTNQIYTIYLGEENKCPIAETFIVNILSCDIIYPEPYLLKLDTTINDFTTLKLKASKGYEYTWSSPDLLSCNDCSEPEAFIERSTTVTCTLTDEYNCSFQEVFIINMGFSYPNVITPNGDGKNEVFIVKNLPENSQFMVFNRNGELVYETNNYQNDWRGRDRQGKLLPQDTYWFVISEPNMNIYFKDYVLIKR